MLCQAKHILKQGTVTDVFSGGFREPGPRGAGGAAGSPMDDQTGGDRAKGHPKNELQRSTGQSSVQAVRSCSASQRAQDAMLTFTHKSGVRGYFSLFCVHRFYLNDQIWGPLWQTLTVRLKYNA